MRGYKAKAIIIRETLPSGFKIIFYDSKNIFVYEPRRGWTVFHRWFAGLGSYNGGWRQFRHLLLYNKFIDYDHCYRLANRLGISSQIVSGPPDLSKCKTEERVIDMTEAQLQEQVVEYLQLKHPGVLFHSDFGSGVKLTMGQAVRQKRLNGGRRAWPDMFIAEPGRAGDLKNYYAGLFIELKKEGVRLKKKNGEWASEHIAEQAEVLKRLRFRGYKAEFAVGFAEATVIIDKYLNRR